MVDFNNCMVSVIQLSVLLWLCYSQWLLHSAGQTQHKAGCIQAEELGVACLCGIDDRPFIVVLVIGSSKNCVDQLVKSEDGGKRQTFKI